MNRHPGMNMMLLLSLYVCNDNISCRSSLRLLDYIVCKSNGQLQSPVVIYDFRTKLSSQHNKIGANLLFCESALKYALSCTQIHMTYHKTCTLYTQAQQTSLNIRRRPQNANIHTILLKKLWLCGLGFLTYFKDSRMIKS